MHAPSLIEALVECAEGKITKTAVRGIAEVDGRERLDVKIPSSIPLGSKEANC